MFTGGCLKVSWSLILTTDILLTGKKNENLRSATLISIASSHLRRNLGVNMYLNYPLIHILIRWLRKPFMTSELLYYGELCAPLWFYLIINNSYRLVIQNIPCENSYAIKNATQIKQIIITLLSPYWLPRKIWPSCTVLYPAHIPVNWLITRVYIQIWDWWCKSLCWLSPNVMKLPA